MYATLKGGIVSGVRVHVRDSESGVFREVTSARGGSSLVMNPQVHKEALSRADKVLRESNTNKK